jgi:hypothetical protein
MRKKRSAETSEGKQKNREYIKNYMRKKRSAQTSEDKQKNCEYIKNYMRKKRSAQTSEDKQKNCEYIKKYMRKKRSAQTSEDKRKNRECRNEYRKKKRSAASADQNKHKEHSLKKLISKFHDIVSNGPIYICTCCDQLWYKHSVFNAARIRQSNPTIQKHLLGKRSVDNIEWLCRTCQDYLAKNKIPRCVAVNGMQFPSKPAFFYLNELECRLLAPRLAFQKLMQAPRGKQLKISGNIVNVPADIANTVGMLPRLPNETGTIKVNLKRRLQYKSSALSLNVRPNKVLEAAKWLVNNGDLYKEEGIILNDTWLEDNSNIIYDERV